MNNEATLEARQLDITTLDVDAIVNAANESRPGGGAKAEAATSAAERRNKRPDRAAQAENA